MDFGIISALSSNPDITKAAITGIVTSLGKVFGESGLKLLGQGRDKFLDTAGELTQQGKELLAPIARKYIENYTDRHGQLRVLGMGKPVSLESIYTQVNFDPEFIQTFRTVDNHEKAFRTRNWSKKDCRLGMAVANETPYMMVLGGPGMGKSTFLRKVGLEALKQGQGEYRHVCIPVFLELRKYRWDKATGINLLSKIAEEFENCGLPEYQECTERLLKQGKLLVLFDGLDEVPTELLGQMTEAIKNLVDRYSKNQFIASCRIAAYRSFQSFSRFTDVAIANFDELQIRCFIENWFKSHDRVEWGQECQVRLSSEDHQATRELAQTPLLLTLICVLFLKHGELPTKRATLYDKALSTLLEEWDASKEIVRQKIYKGLDTRGKEIMLAEIAYSNFTQNNLFFQHGEIAQQIEQILREVLPEERQTSGRDVLRAVEEQHGLLVNRYDTFYSFSHLTIQELLTAKHIIYNQLDISMIVREHLGDKRWREVFLLLAGLRKADELLLAIDKEARNYMTTPKLQQLLIWVEAVADPTPGDFQPVGKRALAMANAIAIIYVNIHAKATYSNFCAEAYDDIYAIANANEIDNIKNIRIAYGNDNIKDIYAYDDTYSIDCFIRYVNYVVKSKIYQGLDLTSAIKKVEELKNQIPRSDEPRGMRKRFTRQLIKVFLTAFHLTPKMVDLFVDEVQLLNSYLYSVRLLIECERAAVRRTPEVWSQIEERLLRPAVTTN